MISKSIKKIITVSMLVGFLITSISCGKIEESNDKKNLKIAVSPGPYNDLFDSGIAPILELKGYKIERIDFSDLLLSNVAITEGNVDFSVSQHTAYANNFNEEKDANLVPLVHIPTVPSGIFSLKKAGWIKIKSGIEPIKTTKNDIIENKFNIKITEMDSAQIPRVLDDIDFAVIPGSVVYFANINPSKSLLKEDVLKDLELVVIVNKGQENTKWANDIKDAYKSEEFSKFLNENNKDNYWFIPE